MNSDVQSLDFFRAAKPGRGQPIYLIRPPNCQRFPPRHETKKTFSVPKNALSAIYKAICSHFAIDREKSMVQLISALLRVLHVRNAPKIGDVPREHKDVPGRWFPIAAELSCGENQPSDPGWHLPPDDRQYLEQDDSPRSIH
jgi:hypothetical protein